MEKFKIFISVVCALFFGFLVSIGSVAGIVQLLFMVMVYFFSKSLRYILRLVTKKDFVLVVIFGTVFGLFEEVLWFVFDPEIYWSSLFVDLVSMLPVYFVFYIVVYFLAEKFEVTQRRAFLYGGVFGYVFYFVAESGLFGFQIGGIPGASIPLVMVWEINNFFLSGLLVWFPLYVSGLLSDSE
ncbi:MAG: hypothetical protein DRN71_02350 [Candidatus Nanohalarchaeota archaeon]|nr:MAG: hypothetical protein DRN71_02350 [Candidatus Nanohaloarchaeota archaeon]